MGARGYSVTLPPDDDFYLVREEQLEELEKGGSTRSLQISIACLGVALGYVPSAIETLREYSETDSIPAFDLVLLVIFVALIVVFVAKLFEHLHQKSNVNTLLAKIKAGQKVKVDPETRST